MSTLLHVASFGAGALLGLAYFRALWATVSGLADNAHATRRILLGLAVRLAVALVAFGLLTHYAGWTHTVAALAGFMVSRLAFGRGRLGRPAAGGPEA